jgi:hypothetical protein
LLPEEGENDIDLCVGGDLNDNNRCFDENILLKTWFFPAGLVGPL